MSIHLLLGKRSAFLFKFSIFIAFYETKISPKKLIIIKKVSKIDIQIIWFQVLRAQQVAGSLPFRSEINIRLDVETLIAWKHLNSFWGCFKSFFKGFEVALFRWAKNREEHNRFKENHAWSQNLAGLEFMLEPIDPTSSENFKSVFLKISKLPTSLNQLWEDVSYFWPTFALWNIWRSSKC